MAALRVLIQVLCVGLLLWLLRRLLRQNKSTDRRTSAPPASQPSPALRMLSCVQCGIHLPEAEALERGGRHFCGEAHREAFDRQASVCEKEDMPVGRNRGP